MTPRRTRLIRVPDLHEFRRAIRSLATGPAHDSFVLVPTHAAAHQLARPPSARQALSVPPGSASLPVTRDEFYDVLLGRLVDPPMRLTSFERDAIMQGAASTVGDLPFQIRPGLIAEMLRFYDQLRRQSQSVQRFQELMQEALGGGAAEVDRGAERLLGQTRFLAEAFRGYERRVAESRGCDEHTLRDQVLGETADLSVRHVVVTMPDWIADPDGLFVADFDLLARMPGLQSIDIVCTEAVLGSGFHERLHGWWPGLDEQTGIEAEGVPRVPPTLMTPQAGHGDQAWFTYRDREEELTAVARRINLEGRTDLDRTAVVFKRPLPYLYLAPDTLGAADIPFQSLDTLPLAAEPTAAAVDLVLDFVEANFTRPSIVALLRTPHLQLVEGADPLSSTAVLDRCLSEARYLGELPKLEALGRVDPLAATAFAAALEVARELAPLLEPAPASTQIRRLLVFLEARLRRIDDSSPFAQREARARAAILQTLAGMADAHAAHHDPPWSIEECAAAVRRWIGEQTFIPGIEGAGVQLLDDQAARYADVEDLTLVGLVEREWPERPRRNIFYPVSLLKALGWPSEKDRRGADEARFLDLLASATRRLVLSTFTLDDEALVTQSMLLDEVPGARLSMVAAMPDLAKAPDLKVGPTNTADASVGPAHVTAPVGRTNAAGVVGRAERSADVGRRPDLPPSHEASADRHSLGGGGQVGRAERSADVGRRPDLQVGRADDPAFHGSLGPQPSRSWSVSALETYLDCPFKFFAQHVLRLQEEPDEEEVMDPRRQGLFVHQVFEAFFGRWQAAGHRAITPENLDDARRMFAEVVEGALVDLPSAEAGLERTRLIGSSAAVGLGEAVLRMEAERPVGVVERLLEHRFDKNVTITTTSGPRTVSLRGKADRLDLLADGTFRLIDYKLGWPPNRSRALQLPVYGLAAEQQLSASRKRAWRLGEAVYLAFKGPRRVVPLFSSPTERDEVLAAAEQRLADTLDAIERGEFPPKPDDVYRCDTCGFASVCRKDYVGDV